jgi:hypothetical protein
LEREGGVDGSRTGKDPSSGWVGEGGGEEIACVLFFLLWLLVYSVTRPRGKTTHAVECVCALLRASVACSCSLYVSEICYS